MTLFVLICLAFCAGLIDAAVGCGGLIQIPALFSQLPLELPTRLFGTSKIASVCGTGFAARSFWRRVKIPWALVLPAALSAFIFSFCGAALGAFVPKDLMRATVLVMLVGMSIYTFIKKDFGAVSQARLIGTRERIISIFIGGGIGFYDGLFGPATGSFLIFLFVRCFSFDFLQASASSKSVNIATNIAALFFFVPTGNVLWGFALPMALANIGGAVLGSWLAMTRGTQFIRLLFLGLLAILIIKLTYELLG